jgi:hypothetical protein
VFIRGNTFDPTRGDSIRNVVLVDLKTGLENLFLIDISCNTKATRRWLLCNWGGVGRDSLFKENVDYSGRSGFTSLDMNVSKDL